VKGVEGIFRVSYDGSGINFFQKILNPFIFLSEEFDKLSVTHFFNYLEKQDKFIAESKPDWVC
jgi:hypothetical protein